MLPTYITSGYQDIIDSVTVTINMKDSVLAMAEEDRRWKAWGEREYLMEGDAAKIRLGRPDHDDISAADACFLKRPLPILLY